MKEATREEAYPCPPQNRWDSLNSWMSLNPNRTGKSVLLFHHFGGTGERVFLPVCYLMLGGLCRMGNGLESPFSFLHHSEGTGERVFLPVCVIMFGGLCRT